MKTIAITALITSYILVNTSAKETCEMGIYHQLQDLPSMMDSKTRQLTLDHGSGYGG